MTPLPARVAVVLVAAALAFTGVAAAQTTPPAPPAQIDNHANGLAYQPTEGAVTARERSAGVEPSGRQLSKEDQELDQINRQLLGDKAAPPVRAPAH